MEVALATMLTAGVTGLATFITTELDITVTVVAQAALEVSTTETTSPFVREALEYVGVLTPTFVPFSFH